MKKILYSLALSLTILTTGCDDFFTPDTDEILLENDYVGNYAELYSGYMGLAACVQSVVDQAIFIEGLRGDLLEPTDNAPREIWDVYNYSDLSSNTFVNPKGFYNLILNANDYLQHVFEYRKENLTVLSDSSYDGIIGGALRFKAWGYLMLAKIYGEAVYLDEPLISLQDLSKYPKLDFDQLIDKCIYLIEMGENGVDGMGEIRWSTELFPGQGDSPERLEWNRICPTAQCLLAELYLYKVKNTNPDELNKSYYQKVWNNCVSVIRTGGEEASFQLNLNKYDGSWLDLFSEKSYNRMEHIAVSFYDYTLKQTNHIIEYFSDQVPNKYYLRPTQAAVNRWVNNNDKNRGNGKSYKTSTSNNLVFNKNLASHTASDFVYRNDVFICYYRASDVHLWLAEACAGLGRFQEALTFINGGIGSFYNKNEGKFDPPFSEYPVSLYESPGKASLKSCMGIRGRVSAPAVGEYLLDTNSELTVDPLVAVQTIDSLLVEESCLESAGEARSYYAMLRMAKRWGTKSQADWAKTIGEKYTNGGVAVRSKLESDINNWFIKYDLKLAD